MISPKTNTNADYADDLALLANTPIIYIIKNVRDLSE